MNRCLYADRVAFRRSRKWFGRQITSAPMGFQSVAIAWAELSKTPLPFRLVEAVFKTEC
jgi:hypothetical protein